MSSYIGAKIIPFPHHGGKIPEVIWIVAHTLECEAKPGLAEDLARGYFQNEKVSVHCVNDPSITIGGLLTDTQGWHAGATGNKYALADEVTGRAGWSQSTWLNGNPRLALQRQWIAMAQLGVAVNFRPEEFRWLSLAEVKSRSVRGFCGHVDISMAFGESNHWDPGPEYPYAIGMTNIRWYAGVADYWGLDPGTRPGDAPLGPGGGETDWFANASLLDVALACAGK